MLQDAGQGHLVEHLPKSIGFGMGLEFRESINLLKAGNERQVAAGMVFNVAVGACISYLSQPFYFCLMPGVLLTSASISSMVAFTQMSDLHLCSEMMAFILCQSRCFYITICMVVRLKGAAACLEQCLFCCLYAQVFLVWRFRSVERHGRMHSWWLTQFWSKKQAQLPKSSQALPTRLGRMLHTSSRYSLAMCPCIAVDQCQQ